MTQPSLRPGWQVQHLEIHPSGLNGEKYPCVSGFAKPLSIRLNEIDNETVVVQTSDPGFRGRPGRAGTLPPSLTTLVGRDAEIGAGLRLFRVAAPADAGWSRWCWQDAGWPGAAEAASGLFADGIVFVSLAPIGDPALVSALIAAAFQLPETDGMGWLASLSSRLRSQHVLLVLDNFEHVLGAAHVVSEVRGECQALSIVTTSRSPLMLVGEARRTCDRMELRPDVARAPSAVPENRDDPEPRYQRLHVVREFAIDRLISEGERRIVIRSCAAYLGQLARQVGAARGTDRERGHVRISEEVNNIRAIFSWSLSDEAEPADVGLALELAGDLWFYWIHYTRALVAYASAPGGSGDVVKRAQRPNTYTLHRHTLERHIAQILAAGDSAPGRSDRLKRWSNQTPLHAFASRTVRLRS